MSQKLLEEYDAKISYCDRALENLADDVYNFETEREEWVDKRLALLESMAVPPKLDYVVKLSRKPNVP